MIDWKNAPEGVTHWDSFTMVFCNEHGYWDKHNEFIDYDNQVEWGTDRYTPRPVVEAVAPTVEQSTNVTVDETIETRGERYGKFNEGAEIMQDLKNVMLLTPGWERLTPSQREALEMIQHKIGRALNGDPTYDDNWRDICGYSQLILDELNGDKR